MTPWWPVAWVSCMTECCAYALPSCILEQIQVYSASSLCHFFVIFLDPFLRSLIKIPLKLVLILNDCSIVLIVCPNYLLQCAIKCSYFIRIGWKLLSNKFRIRTHWICVKQLREMRKSTYLSSGGGTVGQNLYRNQKAC